MNHLTDRERILSHIIRRLAVGQVLPGYGARFRRSDILNPGDVVSCVTATGYSAFSVAVVEFKTGYSSALVRDIAGPDTCHITNEAFDVIDGLDRSDPVFLIGKQRAFYEKVIKAFKKAREYNYRYGGIRFESDTQAAITVRCPFGGSIPGKRAVPFEVAIKFNSRTSIKQILAKLREGGYGTHEYAYADDPGGAK